MLLLFQIEINVIFKTTFLREYVFSSISITCSKMFFIDEWLPVTKVSEIRMLFAKQQHFSISTLWSGIKQNKNGKVNVFTLIFFKFSEIFLLICLLDKRSWANSRFLSIFEVKWEVFFVYKNNDMRDESNLSLSLQNISVMYFYIKTIYMQLKYFTIKTNFHIIASSFLVICSTIYHVSLAFTVFYEMRT